MRHTKNKKHPRKDKGQRIHFKKRLFERYGLNINREEMTDLVKQITDGKAYFVRKSTNRISIFIVTYQGKEITVAYDKGRKQVVSAIPSEERVEEFDVQ